MTSPTITEEYLLFKFLINNLNPWFPWLDPPGGMVYIENQICHECWYMSCQVAATGESVA